MRLRLVDQLGRPEDAQAAALARAEGAEIFEFARYRARPHAGGPVIAVVQGEGAIISGPEQNDFFSDESVMTSDRIAQALLDASAAEDVRAIAVPGVEPRRLCGGLRPDPRRAAHRARTRQDRGGVDGRCGGLRRLLCLG
ncbi:MAG: hypothetical protein NVV62_04815 [Terricaulis sp.]|nr:hypothetical protein [Terricaulis sp.]